MDETTILLRNNNRSPVSSMPKPVLLLCTTLIVPAAIILILSFTTPPIICISFSYQLLIMAAILSLLIAIFWNFTCTDHYRACVCRSSIGWEKVPTWAVFSLTFSASLAILLFAGATKRMQICYPYTVSGPLFTLSVLLLVIGLLGVYDFGYDPCGAAWLALVNLYNFVIHFFDIVTDVIAACNVYYAQDYKFFIISITFSSLTFVIYYVVSLVLTLNGWDEIRSNNCTKFLIFVPIFNILPLIEAYPLSGIIGVAFSSFPQYLITVSFALEHNQLRFWNRLSLLFSLLSLCSSPFTTGTTQLLRSNQVDAILDQIKHGCVLLVLYLFFVAPIVLLEVTHFFPIFFEYYWYKDIDLDTFVNCLLCFNISKAIFLFLQVPGTGGDWHYWSNMPITIICGNEARGLGFGEFVIFTIIFLIVFSILPLILVAGLLFVCLFLTDEFTLFCWNWIIMMLYLLFAYGGMTFLLFDATDKNVGYISYCMLALTWAFSIWFSISPIFYYAFRRQIQRLLFL